MMFKTTSSERSPLQVETLLWVRPSPNFLPTARSYPRSIFGNQVQEVPFIWLFKLWPFKDVDTCFCVQSCKFTCLVYFVTCMQPLQLVALLCTLLYSACIARGFPGSSAGKEATCNAGDPSSIPGLGTSTGDGIGYPFQFSWASLVAEMVKNPPAMRETWVRSLGWEDPLEEGLATHSIFLPEELPWTEEPGGLQSMRSQRVWHNQVTKHSTALYRLQHLYFKAWMSWSKRKSNGV